LRAGAHALRRRARSVTRWAGWPSATFSMLRSESAGQSWDWGLPAAAFLGLDDRRAAPCSCASGSRGRGRGTTPARPRRCAGRCVSCGPDAGRRRRLAARTPRRAVARLVGDGGRFDLLVAHRPDPIPVGPGRGGAIAAVGLLNEHAAVLRQHGSGLVFSVHSPASLACSRAGPKSA
jgi:hypothetical protein